LQPSLSTKSTTAFCKWAQSEGRHGVPADAET
jgi:hypothetical protein